MKKALPRDDVARNPSVTDSNYPFKKSSVTLLHNQSGMTEGAGI